ncbi:MAG: hypothetical protein HY904_15355 [Deltaproteobacteria bacterium]|nr:hypothetical protein [Deltaproteobacteria bacterium]
MHHLLLAGGLALWGALAAVPARAQADTRVRFVNGDRVYLASGRADGVVKGATVYVLGDGATVARLEVESASEHRSVAILQGHLRAPRTGDVARILDPAPRPPARTTRPRATPRPVKRGEFVRATAQGFQAIAFRAQRPRVTARRTRAEAFLVGEAWAFAGGVGAVSGAARSRVVVGLDTPLDAADTFHATVDAAFTLQGQQPVSTVQRTASRAVARADVRQATLAWRGLRELELSVGRRGSSALRWGLLDGVFATWQRGSGPTLRLALGHRADTVSMFPSLLRPAATAEASDTYRGDWGWAAWETGASWLGRDVVATEATELSARASVNVARRLWVEADGAAVAWLQQNVSGPRASLDRLGVSGGVRVTDTISTRFQARRLGGDLFPSDARLLPPGYAAGTPLYDAAGVLDASVVPAASWSAGAALLLGATWDTSHAWDRYQLVPELRGRLSALWGLSARAAWRCELGRTGLQAVELALAAEPVKSLRVGARLQTGLWILQDVQRVEPFQVATVDASTGMGPWRLGLRGRSTWGNTGNGAEAVAFIGAVAPP